MQNKILTLLAACMLLITLTPKPAEAFVKFRTNYFSSPVKGTILYNGEPVVGAQVKRELVGMGEDGIGKFEDETVTDAKGQFDLPEVKNKTYFFRPQIWSANPRVSQYIDVIYEAERYAIWTGRKYDFKKGTDTDGSSPEIILSCELTNNDGKGSGLGYYTVDCSSNKKKEETYE